MIRIAIFSCCLVSLVNILSAQNFYLLDTLYNINTGGSHSKNVVDINTCAIATTHNEFGNPIGINHSAPDITFTGETPGPGIPISLQIDDDPINNPLLADKILYSTFMWPFGTALSGPPYAPEITPRGISVDYNSEPYIIGEYLSYMESLSIGVTQLGILPPLFRPKGQMTFREGSFYYPSVNNELVQLKIAGDNYWMRSLGSLPDTLQYGGIFSVPYSCDSTTTYVIHHDPQVGSTMYVLDMPTLELQLHCTMPYKPNAAAYEFESTLPPCNWVLDLDTNDDTTIHRFDTICSGTITLLDSSTAFEPDLEADSMTVTLLNPQDGTQEWLSFSGAASDVTSAGSNSHKIGLASTGFTKGSSFLSVLDGLSYTNNATVPTTGVRLIQIDLYHPFYGILSARIEVIVTTSNITVTANNAEPNCFGENNGSITLTPSNGNTPYEIAWEDATMGAINENLIAGEYTFQVIDAANCSIDESVVLGQPDSLIVTISSPVDSVCGESGLLIPSVTGGIPAYQYNWNTGNTDSLLTNAGPGNYNLEVEDGNGCLATATDTLWALPVIMATYQEELCAGDSTTINGTVYTSYAQFELSLPTSSGCDSLVAIQLNFADTFAQSFQYELCAGQSLTIYDQLITGNSSFSVPFISTAGCDSTEYYLVTLSQPTSTLQAAICEGETYAFAGSLLTTAGQYIDTLQATNGCDSLSILNLAVIPNPTPVILTDGSLCTDATTLLFTNDNYTSYQWTSGINSSTVTVSNTGTYTLTVTDTQGCMGTASISLTDESPQLNYTVQQPACADGTGQLFIEAISGGTPPYQSSNGTPITANMTLGTYAIGPQSETIFDANDCATTIEFIIVPSVTFSANLAESMTIKLGESIPLPLTIVGTPNAINWAPNETLSCSDCTNPIATPIETTNYTVLLSNDDGCSWEGSILVRVDFQGMYLPNVFSPNGDANNDDFYPFPSAAVEEILNFSIYNRWGGAIFSSTSNTPSWNGTIGGEQAPAGVYLYFVEWRDKAGIVQTEKGEVVLLR